MTTDNPVSSDSHAEIDATLCMGCGTCRDTCPADAISSQDGVSIVSCEKCNGCGACVEVCPGNAIMMKTGPSV